MPSAVLDTNVLASGIVGAQIEASIPGRILRAWRDGRFVLVSSEAILSELSRTLRKDYFRQRLAQSLVDDLIGMLRSQARVTPLTVQTPGVATHPEDDLVIATAISARAEYLVTGDRGLQQLGAYMKVNIVSPRQFLTILDTARGAE